MRVAAFAITLMLGGAAIAQSTTTTHSDHTGAATADVSAQAGVETDVDVNAQATTSTTPAPSTTESSWSSSTQTTTGATTGQTTLASNMGSSTIQPSNANPERDARGIKVMSDPAMAPAGYNGAAGTGMGGPVGDAAASTGAEASHPACSATVTDNCVQTYERGRAPR